MITVIATVRAKPGMGADLEADFRAWADSYRLRHPQSKFKIVNDGSTSDDDKLGAIGDINLVLTREDGISKSDLIVVAGDNLFSEPLTGFSEMAKSAEAMIGVYDVGSLEAIRKYGCAEIDANGVLTHFEEKPEKPKSTLAAIALYYYAKEVLPLFKTYLAAGNNPDQPGRFVQWLYTRKRVQTFESKGKWLDIGSKETLEEANTVFADSTT